MSEQLKSKLRTIAFSALAGGVVGRELGVFARGMVSGFFDIAEPVLRYGSEICRYVGDEVIVTWKTGSKRSTQERSNAPPRSMQVLPRGTLIILSIFGAKPVFRVALHV